MTFHVGDAVRLKNASVIGIIVSINGCDHYVKFPQYRSTRWIGWDLIEPVEFGPPYPDAFQMYECMKSR